MSDFSSFRNEILETAKARVDLLKWKLIGVSALGSVGLGLTKTDGSAPPYLILALIPFVCFYVDLLCQHFALRILVIARFLTTSPKGEQAAYECFVEKTRNMGPKKKINVFDLESWALYWSTWVMSILTVFAGFILPPCVESEAVWEHSTFGFVMFGKGVDGRSLVISGLAGFVLTSMGWRRFRYRAKLLVDLASDPKVTAELADFYNGSASRRNDRPSRSGVVDQRQLRFRQQKISRFR
jgi:hypothetical protein